MTKSTSGAAEKSDAYPAEIAKGTSDRPGGPDPAVAAEGAAATV